MRRVVPLENQLDSFSCVDAHAKYISSSCKVMTTHSYSLQNCLRSSGLSILIVITDVNKHSQLTYPT